MKSAKYILLLLALALVAPACTAAVGSDTMEEAESDDLGGKEDGVARPEGSYLFAGQSVPGTIRTLELNAETKEFHMVWSTFANMRSLHDAEESGTYRFTKSGRNRFIRFYTEQGDLLNRYQYRLSGETLQLHVDWGSSWFDMEPTPADAFDAWAVVVKAHFIQNYIHFVEGIADPEIQGLPRGALPDVVEAKYDEFSDACGQSHSCHVEAYTDQVDGQAVLYVVQVRPTRNRAALYDENGRVIATGSEASISAPWVWDSNAAAQ